MADFLGTDNASRIVDLMSGGVKDVTDMPSNAEVVKFQEEEIYKSQVSSSRAMAFERRKRLPYLIQKGLSKSSRISFDVLRRASRSVHIVRICITTLKEKVAKTPWVIQSRDPKKDIDPKKIERITEFFTYPNQNGDNFRRLLDKMLEDLLTLDQVVLEKTRYPDGTLAELHFVDGASIRPIYDEHGNQDVLLPFAREDGDPEMLPVSYVQVVDDNPWGGREAGQPVAFWSKKDMIVFNMHPQGDMASFGYGLSPIEAVIGVVSNMLSADNFNSTYFEEGAFPPMMIQFMAKMGSRELEQLREYMRTELEGRFYRPAILAGQEEIKTIPLKELTQRDMQFMNYMDFMARLLAAAYGLKAQDVGLTDGENFATAKTQKDQMQEQGYGSILALLKEVFNQQIIWKDFGYTDIEFDWTLTDSINPETASAIYDTALKNGSMTLNEVRKKQNLLPFDEWADTPAIYTADGYLPIVPHNDDKKEHAEGHESELGGETVFQEEHEAKGSKDSEDLESAYDENNGGSTERERHNKSIRKSIITEDGKYRCWSDDRGVSQPFIFSDILKGTGWVIKPPVAVNLDSQKLEEKMTHQLAAEGLPVVAVTRMTTPQVMKLFPDDEVKEEFLKYQQMSPSYDSEKYKAKYGSSRKADYYMVSKYYDGRNLTDQLLLQDIARVPNDYRKAIDDLAKLWLREKELVAGDRRADQYLILPNKRAIGFDYQFFGNVSRWEGTKNAIPKALQNVPELKQLFMELTGQLKTKKSFIRKVFSL